MNNLTEIKVRDFIHDLKFYLGTYHDIQEDDPDYRSKRLTVMEIRELCEQAIEGALGWLCLDCGVHCGDIDEYYMIHDHLWDSLTLKAHDGMLCIGCLETRLGRELTAVDFTDAPINTIGVFDQSDRLLDRISGRKLKLFTES